MRKLFGCIRRPSIRQTRSGLVCDLWLFHGEVFELGDGVRLEILHHGLALDPKDRNENSISMKPVYGDFTVLLTGDAEDKAKRMMMENGRPLQSIVFKAGHHGCRVLIWRRGTIGDYENRHHRASMKTR